MSKKYINISSANTDLLTNTMKQETGDINSINIANTNASTAAVIDLYLEDIDNTNNDYYFFKNLNLPSGASLLLDKGLSFNISKYSLKLHATGTTNLTVIIT